MFKSIKSILILCISITIYCCHKGNEPVIPETNYNFGLYYLRDSIIKIYNILDTDLNSLELEKKPFISDQDVEFYDFSSHCIYLKQDKSNFFPYNPGLDPFPRSYFDKPFILVGNGNRCYAGYIQSVTHVTDFWHVPDIDYFSMKLYPKDILHIDWEFDFAEDGRDNESVKEALINTNLYHAGIRVEITNIAIYQSDTSTVVYTIKIANNDKDNLYVFDPDKIGTELFHFYTNGPRLLDTNLRLAYDSDYNIFKVPEPISKWDPEWFTKIESNNSIKRTIILKGYPFIPFGEYLCQFSFNVVLLIEKGSRILPDGRYWIGKTYSGIIEINHQKTTKCKIQKYMGGIQKIITNRLKTASEKILEIALPLFK